MKNLTKLFIVLILFVLSNNLYSQLKTIDDFEISNGWNEFKSDGVTLKISSDAGLHGNAVRFDYDFTKGTGYGGIQKLFPIDLPENFEFSFYVKAESPANNFEIKFIDSTGHNVWWVNNRNYEFPKEWKKIRLKKRHIGFAWGPTEDHSFKRVDRIEFTIASYMGGKGTIWVDDLKFEQLPPETNVYPNPMVTSSEIPTNMVVDNIQSTDWVSQKTSNEFLLVNFNARREFGGLKIDWKNNLHAQAFEILISDDGNNWDKVYSVNSNLSGISFIRLPEAEAKYLKINLLKSSSSDGFGVNEISFLDLNDATTKNNFLLYVAKNSARGNYPRYLSNEASFWTVLGVNNDVKEAMINIDGMVEVDKSAFSIEPMLKIGNEYFNWNNVTATQSLEDKYLPIPKVNWNCSDVNLDIEAFTNGEANKNSTLYLKYKITNNSSSQKDGKLFLMLRPHQVNPHYQWLNDPGGAGKINSLNEKDGRVYVNDDKVVIPLEKYDSFSAITFDDGNIVELIKENKILNNKSVTDEHNLASGFMEYNFNLNPGNDKIVYLTVPFYGEASLKESITQEVIEKKRDETANFWKSEVDHIKFNLPESADRIINAYKSNLAYVLINRDKVGIQPGSRSYERSWMRDGALTSSALLKSGIVTEVKDYINWYASHQYENGKVPCVVDKRGPDPTPENDSHGELIYLIREYFNFTKDTTFLRLKNENVLKAVEYMESLIAERSTDHFKNGNDSVKAYYGLITESISHEGYSEKAMHSYWDDLFVMKGFKDAVEIQEILGEKKSYERIKKVRDTFKTNLYNSFNLAMKMHKINYLPGCVEKGDFDATSTTIALTPCNEFKNLPKPEVYNTFDKYFEFFQNRRDGKIDWINYTPYENRLIGSFILLDQPERAHQLIDFFLSDQVPYSWNAFAEVVWRDKKTAGFIGDIPHTWVGSDFINAIRTLFVYENEYDESLVLGSALYQDWIDTPNGMSIENLPTYYGEISYSIKKGNEKYNISIYGEIKLPKNGIKIKNFNGSKLPVKVSVNGKKIKSFTNNEITVKDFPATVIIDYQK